VNEVVSKLMTISALLAAMYIDYSFDLKPDSSQEWSWTHYSHKQTHKTFLKMAESKTDSPVTPSTLLMDMSKSM